MGLKEPNTRLVPSKTLGTRIGLTAYPPPLAGTTLPPRTMAITAIPTHRPSLRDPTAPTGPSTCQLHGPDSPYTRNTLGYYSSYAPPCCGPAGGCHIGLREAAENRLGNLIMEDVILLRNRPNDTAARSRLRQNYDLLRHATSVLVTPLSEARLVLAPIIIG